MAMRAAKGPGAMARLKQAHEATALTALILIAAHGLVLLGDSYLRPGLAGIAIPFVMSHKPLWTGLGVIGGWLAALSRSQLLRPPLDRPQALAPDAPLDAGRLRPRRRPHARRRDRCPLVLAVGDLDRDRRAARRDGGDPPAAERRARQRRPRRRFRCPPSSSRGPGPTGATTTRRSDDPDPDLDRVSRRFRRTLPALRCAHRSAASIARHSSPPRR